MYLILIPVSSNNFFSGSDPMFTAVPKYRIVGVPEACIAGNPVIKPEPRAAPANAVVDLSMLLLVIFLFIFLDISTPFKKSNILHVDTNLIINEDLADFFY